MEMTADKKYKRRMAKAGISFTVVLVLAILIEMQITWVLTKNGAEKSTILLLNQIETILNDNEKDEKERTEELKDTYIAYARSVAYILDATPELIEDIDELDKIAELQQIDEIHIFNETGTIIAGTVPAYYGYSFDSGEQMGYFKPMLEDKTLAMCQDVTPNTAEGKSMMYAIVWNQDGTYMIQVGIEPKRLLEELKENDISNVISNIPITEGFDIYVIDTGKGEIAATTNKNDISNVSLSECAKKIGKNGSDSGNGIIKWNGMLYYCSYRPINDYIVAVAYNMNNSNVSMIVSLVIISLYLLIAETGILKFISKFYKSEEKQKVLNENLEKANRDQEEQLSKITALNETLTEDEGIIKAAGHGIWRCPIDADGHVCGMIGNEQWKIIYGAEDRKMTPEENLEYFVNGLVDKAGDPRNYDYSDFRQGEVVSMTFAWNHPKKGVIYVEISSAMHTMSDGTIQISGYAADVTEEAVSKQKWEEELIEASNKAETANLAKTAFLFNMSHDIRTPLNAIIGYTDLIEKHYDDKEKCMDYLHKTQQANKFLLSLINDVLEMARIESGKENMDESVCPVGSIAEEAAEIFRNQIEKKGITFESHIETKTKWAFYDKTKVSKIYLNILSNAFKYTSAGGKITMRVNELACDRPGYILMKAVFSDTGRGMSKEFLPHLFESFSREQTSTESRQQGTGLGMTIVKSIIDFIGGTIDVESELGKGTTFTVTYPLKTEGAEPAQTMESNNTEAADFSGKRILLAEDNDFNAEIAVEILSEAGFEVERAADGVICVDMLKKAPEHYYDVILMDVQMPNMDGYTATRTIRALDNPVLDKIPIIAMTANAFDEDKKNALEAGMNGHLTKPIDVSKLMETLAEFMRLSQ